MIKLIDLLKEAKSVGILYHYTRLSSLIKIINTNTLISHLLNDGDFDDIGGGEDDEMEGKYYISFTRDKNFHKDQEREIAGTDCRIVIDGNKLSNNYKIQPTAEQHYQRKYQGSESEERITKDKYFEINNLDNYIIQFDIFLDEINTRRDLERIKNIINLSDKVHFLFKGKEIPKEDIQKYVEISK
jgi:hypothetical protein